MTPSRRCLVVDANPLTRFALDALLSERFEVETLGCRLDAIELVRDVGGFQVTVIDTCRVPAEADGEPSGTEAIQQIRRREATAGIVARGPLPARHLANEAIRAGATAYLSRTADPDQVRTAVAKAANQETFIDSEVPPKGHRGPITARQREILQLLSAGRSTAYAAESLSVSEETVKTHMKHILARLQARNRAHAVAIALRENFIE